MKKMALLTATCISVLLFSAVAGIQLITLTKGNPFSQSAYSGVRSPSVKVNPPEVSVLSPQHARTYSTPNVLLYLNLSTKGSETLYVSDLHYISGIGIKEVYFTADWLQNETMIYRGPRIEDYVDNAAKFFFMGDWYDNYQDLPKIDFENLSLSLTNIPDGNHTISVYAVGSGSEHTISNWYVFYIIGFSKISFVIDTPPPKVTVVPIMNDTHVEYDVPEIPLNFTISEQSSQVTCSLDGKENVTVAGNTTLAGLSFGVHNVTVYAWDEAGNVGVSETITFTIAEPFPAVPVAAASAASIAVVGIGLLVYFKKRTR